MLHRQDLPRARSVEYLWFPASFETRSWEGNTRDLRGAAVSEKGSKGTR